MKCEEIFAALELLEKERGIPQDFMMGKIIQALTAAYKKDHEGVENVIVDVNEEKKDLRMYVQKEIVEEVENPGSQISLEDARAMSAKYQLGGVVNIPVKNVEFGRIAAGNGKQVIIQGLREAEHGMIYDEWGSKEHEILTGTVHRIDPRGTVHLRIGSGNEATEGLMGSNEQVPGEELTEGQLVKVYLVEVRRTTRGPQVMVSRTHPGLVKRLFELEVPEIYDGTVEIRSIAREAGSRTKMAVWSSDENVDPIGACVGPKGQRVAAVVNELRGEKIDIIRRPRRIHRRRPGSRRRGGGAPVRRGQALPGHRPRRPAEPGHRQGGAERPPGRPSHRVQDRHQARFLHRGVSDTGKEDHHAEAAEDSPAHVRGLPGKAGQKGPAAGGPHAGGPAGAGRHRQEVRPGRLCVPGPAVPEKGPEIPGAGPDAGGQHPRRGV